MSLSVNSVAPQTVDNTIELTWYEDSYTTMVLPDGTFSFAQGTTVYYNWESGDFPQFFNRLYPYTLFSGTAEQSDVGDYTFVLSATTDDVSYEQVTIHLTVLNVNDAPLHGLGALSEIPDQTINVGDAFSFADTAYYFRDQDGDVLTYSAKRANGSDLPSWLHFDSTTGVFSGTPAKANAGKISVTVTATDPSNASISDTFDLTVVAPPNTAPIGNAKPLRAGTEDEVYYASIKDLLAGFTDADGDTLSIKSFTAKQDGERLDVLIGSSKVKITPLENSDTSIKYVYTVSDGNGGTVSDVGTIKMKAVDDPTVLTTPASNQTINEGDSFRYSLPHNMFTDVDGDAIELSAFLVEKKGKGSSSGGTVLSELPGWLHFDPEGDSGRGVFYGKPKDDDVGSLKIRVLGNEAEDEFIIDVYDVPKVSVESRVNVVSDAVSTGVTLVTLSADGFEPGGKFKIEITNVELIHVSRAKMADGLTNAEKGMFKIEKTVVDGETLYELVTTKKTDDILEDAGKKFTVTLTATDKTGATDDVDVTFKIKHVPNAAHGDQADHAILVMDDASMAYGAHDWSL